MADYLQPDDILNNNEEKLILKVRCQKYIFNNFKNNSKCICLEYADAKHIYECIMLNNSERKHEFNLKFKLRKFRRNISSWTWSQLVWGSKRFNISLYVTLYHTRLFLVHEFKKIFIGNIREKKKSCKYYSTKLGKVATTYPDMNKIKVKIPHVLITYMHRTMNYVNMYVHVPF